VGRPALRALRRLSRYVAISVLSLVILLGAGVAVTQTSWFKNWLRQKAVSQAAQYLNGELTITRRVGPIGFPKRYDLSHVRNARVGPPPARTSRYRRSTWPGSGAHSAIAFDYGARTFHFGTDLDEAEAHYLLDLLHPRLPRADKGYAAPPS